MEYSYLTAATAFSDSDNSSSVHFTGKAAAGAVPESAAPAAEVEALRRLSNNLGSAFQSPDFEFLADARLVVGSHGDGGGGPPSPRVVGVHRCVLSARSPFFREEFAKRAREAASPPPVRVELKLKELVKDFEVGYDALVAVLGYMYTGRVAPLPKEVCVCVDDECRHEACRPAVDFMAEVLCASFVFQISELVSLFQRHLLDILEKVAIDDMPMILSVAKLCDKSCSNLLNKCIEIVIKSDLDLITLEKTMPPDIVKQITDSRRNLGQLECEGSGFPDKHVRRIHRALDSDDVELVRMLLKEGNTTLDDACALHYAVAYCDSKITTELLDLALADVNHRNLRGYTVLHLAAMRKEPKIIVSLLTKGARPSDLMSDGRKALHIAKRLTKSAEYLRSIGEGEPCPKSRLCIELLEQAERRDPQVGEASVSLAIAGDDLRGRLLYLENRVALARVLFPMEARVAMDIAQVDGTLEFTFGSTTDVHSPGNQRTAMDLNEAPFKIKEEHLARMRALSKTVECGKRFFPRCSSVIDKLMDDDITELTGLGRHSSEERRRRFLELQDVVSKAFSEDKEENDRSGLSSSSSSTSVGVPRARR
ncbi:BTB/POZ domain and ankyrin repeat-containing protein NPR1 [Canna indica]|uniref:BTB/POZ domain and ankyrin repeat-containing protein NPR1 n=1 Tax=Canna indica TaxID=4628 RepID=A0AAQ3JVQ9_9LILI|nr:BTB/POZ domain and ankyrin repeat-containing protein NPR1 [Canna indica]